MVSALIFSKLLEPGYFKCLLDKSQEEQQKEEVEADYRGEESDGEEDEEPSMLSKSQHFKAGSLAAPQGILICLIPVRLCKINS